MISDVDFNAQLSQEMAKKGATYNIQARILHEICNEIPQTDNNALSTLLPEIRVEKNEDPWEEAVCLVVAYLKRYRMKETVQTMRKEFAATPGHTGYKKGSEVDDIFDSLFDIIERDMKVSFEERVDKFIKTTQIEEPAKRRPRRTRGAPPS